MGSEQSTRRTNEHHVYVYEERQRQQDIRQRELDVALVENQKKLYEKKIELAREEAAKAKAEAEAAKAKAAQAKIAEAKAAAQEATLKAQTAQSQAQSSHTQNIQAQVQAAQAQTVQAQAAQAAQNQAAQNQAAQAHAVQAQAARAAYFQAAQNQAAGAQSQTVRVQAQTIQTRAAPVASPITNNNPFLERNRSPYCLSSQELQQNTNSNSVRVNLYPNLTQSPNASPLSENGQARGPGTVNNGPTPSAPQRDRSSSRCGPRKTKDDNVNCPTCKNTYGMRIYQCPGGHSSCSSCKEQNKKCGICGWGITDMRNITLEEYVSERKIRCPNSVDGCRLFIKNAELESHLKECPFGELTCPLHPKFKQCTWKGKVSQLSAHFKQNHLEFSQADVDTEMILLNMGANQKLLHFITIGNFNFLFHVKVLEQERKICMAAQLIGTQYSAVKWTYEVHVYNKKEPRRKYQYQDVCSSSSSPIDDLFKNTKCVVLPMGYAMTFFNDGLLTYKFFIKKADDAKPGFDNKRSRGRGRGAHNKN